MPSNVAFDTTLGLGESAREMGSGVDRGEGEEESLPIKFVESKFVVVRETGPDGFFCCCCCFCGCWWFTTLGGDFASFCLTMARGKESCSCSSCWSSSSARSSNIEGSSGSVGARTHRLEEYFVLMKF